MYFLCLTISASVTPIGYESVALSVLSTGMCLQVTIEGQSRFL